MTRAIWATFVLIRYAIAWSILWIFFRAPVRFLIIALLPAVYVGGLLKSSWKRAKALMLAIVETLREWEEI